MAADLGMSRPARTRFAPNMSRWRARWPWCRLRSAIHYLRKYPDQTVGFLFSPDEQEKQRLAMIKVARGPWYFEGNMWHTMWALHDCMLRQVMYRYCHVSFWNEED